MSTSSVNVVAHPLVQHKLSLMREKDRSTKSFREILNEIGMLLGYEVTRDLPLELVEIETPISPMRAPKIAGKKLTLAPILRAGVGFVCLLAAPEGIAQFQSEHPDVPIWTAAIDERLNDHGYIVPGLGDAGDRMFGTK